MRIDLGIFCTDTSIRPEEVAREAEARDFGRLFVPEHTHIPVDHSPFPGGRDLPNMYRRILDPFVALTAAATATSRLEVGTGMCLVAQHDPIVVAKAAATIDHLSGGRFVFGVGYGWNRPEVAHHGVDPDDRREVVRERVLAIKALWAEEEASFEGKHVRFAPSWSWPKPVHDIPVLVGAGAGPTTFAHVAEFADAWAPIPGRGGDIGDAIRRMREAVADHGRDPDTVEVIAFGVRPDPGEIEPLAELGVSRVVLWLPSKETGPVIDRMDQFVALRDEFAG